MSRIELAGDIDLAVGEEVHERVCAAAHAAATDGHELVIDLGGVTFMDSTGLNCIAHAMHILGRDGRVVLTRTPPVIRRVLVLAQLDHLCDDA